MKSIKIIAGKYRGKILCARELSQTRPTKAILKESLFNTISSEIHNKVFLEAFAGFGSVGFEAFSRGASEVYFIEKNKESFKVLKKNVSLFGPQDSNKFHCFCADSLVFLPEILRQKNIDILYFDPPFDEIIYARCFETLNLVFGENKKEVLVIFEHNSDFAMPQNLAHLLLSKTRKFGRSALSYYKIIKREIF